MTIGIIIGTAFGKIVTSLVNDVIMPPLEILIGRVDFKNLNVPVVTFNYGQFINTVIDFMIVAFAIFFCIL